MINPARVVASTHYRVRHIIQDRSEIPKFIICNPETFLKPVLKPPSFHVDSYKIMMSA